MSGIVAVSPRFAAIWRLVILGLAGVMVAGIPVAAFAVAPGEGWAPGIRWYLFAVLAVLYVIVALAALVTARILRGHRPGWMARRHAAAFAQAVGEAQRVPEWRVESVTVIGEPPAAKGGTITPR